MKETKIQENNRVDIQNKGFKPSYAQEKKNIDTSIDKKRIKWIIFIVILAVILIAGIIVTIQIFNQRKYEDYIALEESMKKYGFDRMYDNGTANTSDMVTKSEAIKLVIATVYNKYDISGIASEPKEEYSNAIWVEFAQKLGVITTTDVNAENANDPATYSDMIRFFSNAKVKLLDLTLDVEDTGIVKDINQYNMDEKLGILDMVNSDVITIHTDKMNARNKIFKGQANELIINFAEKYNTITISGEKLNINREKIPQNASEYPYTVATVDKSVYEYAFFGKGGERFKLPIEVYADQKEYFYQIKKNVEEYYNTLINIDYQSINEEDLKKKVNQYLLFGMNEEALHEYVEYVKTNHIKLSGTAKIQMPILYFDGTYYRMRTKIELNIESAILHKNLLYGDLLKDQDVVYEEGSHVFYIDTYLSNAINNKTLYNEESSFIDMLCDQNDSFMKLAGE